MRKGPAPPAAMDLAGRLARRLYNAGWRRTCPLCESHVRAFAPFGLVPRPDAACPVCGALERHRLAWLLLRNSPLLAGGRRWSVLHLAPEAPLVRRLKRARDVDYLTADLADPAAMVRMDVTRIDRDAESFDVILCSHVLEHVDDDRQAMRELRRVLRRSGFGVFQVPTSAAVSTLEDPTITDPRERERLFGQSDHVRLYGRDFVSRLESCGFAVRRVTVLELAGDVSQRFGVRGEELFVVWRSDADFTPWWSDAQERSQSSPSQ